jgi:hypothetical protein
MSQAWKWPGMPASVFVYLEAESVTRIVIPPASPSNVVLA